MRTLLLAVLLSLPAAGATRQVVITWTDASNVPSTTYKVFRAAGACSLSNTFVQIAAGLTAKTYTDPAVSPGVYCYVARAVSGTLESPSSNQAEAIVPNFPPEAVKTAVETVP
jgi:hypothetical protein